MNFRCFDCQIILLWNSSIINFSLLFILRHRSIDMLPVEDSNGISTTMMNTLYKKLKHVRKQTS